MIDLDLSRYNALQQRFDDSGINTRYYTPEIHKASFALPKYLVDALAGAGVTDVDATRRRRVEYSSDASLYRVVPEAVAFPRDADEVAAIVDVCRSEEVPVTVRGGGTSTAGNAVGGYVVTERMLEMFKSSKRGAK